MKFFGVWALRPTGECMCPQGTMVQDIRDIRVVGTGTCTRPGKHPWHVKLTTGEVVGFRGGVHDALPEEQWRALEPSVVAGGGRTAVAIPSDMWVLDVDNSRAWSDLLRLIASGALRATDMSRVVRTPRGWHVWIPVSAEGWRTGSAQTALQTFPGVAGNLEVKSGGSYVLGPDGRERCEVPLEVFWRRVASDIALRRSSRGAGYCDGGGGGTLLVDLTPPPPPKNPWQDFDPEGDFPPECWPEGATSPAVLVGESALSEGLKLQAAILRNRRTQGDRNNMLNRIGWIEARAAIKAGAREADVTKLLVDAGVRAGLTRGECEATVRSALTGGEK